MGYAIEEKDFNHGWTPGFAKLRRGERMDTDGESRNPIVLVVVLVLVIEAGEIEDEDENEDDDENLRRQPAVSPTGSRQGVRNWRHRRIANPRYGRLPVCATRAPDTLPVLKFGLAIMLDFFLSTF
jgi:hypothetical protein